MSFYAYNQVDKQCYDRVTRSYLKFIAHSSDPDKESVTVFSPLSEKMLGELELIREVSKELQLKKIEEDRTAKEAEEERKRQEKEENKKGKEDTDTEVQTTEEQTTEEQTTEEQTSEEQNKEEKTE